MRYRSPVVIDNVRHPGASPSANELRCCLFEGWPVPTVRARKPYRARALRRSEAVRGGGLGSTSSPINKRRITQSFLYRFLGPRGSGILVEFVSDAANGQHIMGVLWISFQLLSQPVYMRVDVALIAFILSAPDTIEQIIARPGVAGF